MYLHPKELEKYMDFVHVFVSLIWKDSMTKPPDEVKSDR